MASDSQFPSLDEQLLVIESIGRTLQEDQGTKFEKLLHDANLSATINVTDWTYEAVRALLSVGREKNIKLSLRNGERYCTVVVYPDGPMFSALTESIVVREW